MKKINSIKISGIRGIKDSLTVELDKKSVLIFGENGSGKSSLTDALEWYYSGSVKHLVSEEIASSKGKGALRNLFIPESENAFISVHFSENKLDAKITIGSSLKTSCSNTSGDFNDYLESSQSDNLILRYSDLVEFIIASKTERLKTLQNIIGFADVADIRDLLKKSAGRIERRIKSANFDNQKNAQQSIILENLGQNAHTDEQLFAGSNLLITPLETGKEIKSHGDISNFLKEIESKEDSSLLRKISFFTKIRESLTEINGNIDDILSDYKTYYVIYTELRKDSEKIQKLQLLALLKEGQSILKSDVVKDDYCPLCQQQKSKIELIQDLNARITELEDLENEKSKLDEQSRELNDILRINLNKIDSLLNEKLFEEEENNDLFEKVKKIKNSLKNISDELKKNLFAEDSIQEPSKLLIDKKEIEILAKQAQDKAGTLTESRGQNTRFQIFTKLFQTATAYKSYLRIRKEQEILTNQLMTFQALFADFIKRQESALKLFLERFSKVIDEYYTAMNPGEKIENIALMPIKDKNDDLVGITIEYNFFDEIRVAPIAYLSESHINCLGLSFFLASVKAFNKQNKFIILDDVISSFDRPHRARFAKLLMEKFSDYQIILLTHELEFFELVASDVKSKGWLIKDFKWSKESGVETGKGTIDVKERILKKFEDKNTDGLGNDIRIYTEKIMKKIANDIEAKMAFKYNEANEKRMVPELLDAVQSQISKKGNGLKDKANIVKLKGMPMFIGNTTSHDNDFSVSIKDLEVMWEEIENTVHVFYCSECETFISTKYFDNVENKIRCRCGKLTYDWKK